MGVLIGMGTVSTESIDKRLARIEGQIRGIRRMLAEGKYCNDILMQVAAARSALGKAGSELVIRHTRSCILGVEDGTAHEEARGMSSDELIEELRGTLQQLLV